MSGEGTGFVFRHSPYKGSKLIVHLAIGDVVNDAHENEFWMGVTKLAKKCRLGRSSVVDALGSLVADGFLEVLADGGGRGRVTRYRFLMPETARILDGLDEEQKPRGVDPQTARSTPETARSEGETARSLEVVPITRTKELNERNEPKPMLAVFDAWKQSTGRNGRTFLDAKRKRSIAEALRHYSLEDVIDAVRGWRHSPFHAGQNEQRKVYNELTLLLRDGAQIEQFRDLERGTAPTGARPDPAVDLVRRMREREGR